MLTSLQPLGTSARACHCGRGSDPEVSGTRDKLCAACGHWKAVEATPQPCTDHGVRTVTEYAEKDEDETKHNQLSSASFGRVYELRNEGQEEQSRLRIQHVYDHGVEEDPSHRPRHGAPNGHVPVAMAEVVPDRLHPEVEQVAGAGKLHDGEDSRRGNEDRESPPTAATMWTTVPV